MLDGDLDGGAGRSSVPRVDGAVVGGGCKELRGDAEAGLGRRAEAAELVGRALAAVARAVRREGGLRRVRRRVRRRRDVEVVEAPPPRAPRVPPRDRPRPVAHPFLLRPCELEGAQPGRGGGR